MRLPLLVTGIVASLAGGIALAAVPGDASIITDVDHVRTDVAGPAPGTIGVLVAGFAALGFRRGKAPAATVRRVPDAHVRLVPLPVGRARPAMPVRKPMIVVPEADAA